MFKQSCQFCQPKINLDSLYWSPYYQNDHSTNHTTSIHVSIQHSLYWRYSGSQNFYYTSDINTIIIQKRSIALLRHLVNTLITLIYPFQENLLLDDQDEYLKRFYELDECDFKIKLLTQYYKFHQDIPRWSIDTKKLEDLDNYYYLKRKIHYKNVQLIIQQENQQNPNKPAKGIIGHQPSDTDKNDEFNQEELNQHLSNFLLEVSDLQPSTIKKEYTDTFISAHLKTEKLEALYQNNNCDQFQKSPNNDNQLVEVIIFFIQSFIQKPFRKRKIPEFKLSLQDMQHLQETIEKQKSARQSQISIKPLKLDNINSISKKYPNSSRVDDRDKKNKYKCKLIDRKANPKTCIQFPQTERNTQRSQLIQKLIFIGIGSPNSLIKQEFSTRQSLFAEQKYFEDLMKKCQQSLSRIQILSKNYTNTSQRNITRMNTCKDKQQKNRKIRSIKQNSQGGQGQFSSLTKSKGLALSQDDKSQLKNYQKKAIVQACQHYFKKYKK